jgi:hypothetical protein
MNSVQKKSNVRLTSSDARCLPRCISFPPRFWWRAEISGIRRCDTDPAARAGWNRSRDLSSHGMYIGHGLASSNNEFLTDKFDEYQKNMRRICRKSTGFIFYLFFSLHSWCEQEWTTRLVATPTKNPHLRKSLIIIAVEISLSITNAIEQKNINSWTETSKYFRSRCWATVN